jgi:MFS family permease
MASHTQAAEESAFSPLRQKLFAVLWVAMVIGNIGTFVRDLASAWLMTELSASPFAVALIQAAATLPVMLLAIPAGVLADTLDRRRLLIGIQVLLAVVSTCLMTLALAGMYTVTSLVVLTLLGGIGAALMGPAWQAVVPELVGRADLRNAVTLNSLGLNMARAIGPAVGGVILAAMGAAFTYGVDVISYLFVIAALLWWRPQPRIKDRLAEKFSGAFRAGLRYVRASRELHVVLLRAFLFFAMASALWALLPLVARQLLDGGPGFYGLLLSAVGLGAIAGAVGMPRLRKRLDADALMLLASLLTASVLAFLSLAPPQWAAVLALTVLGAAWIGALTTLNGVAQSILPNWVRGRALAVYLTVFNGAMTFGSLAWGLLAKQTGLPATLLAGAVGLLLVAAMTHRCRLPRGETGFAVSNHWPEPLTEAPVENDRGPVMIQIVYRVPASQRAAFLKLLQALSCERLRDGAYRWSVSEDTADPERLLECFLVESWGEHLRQHRRVPQTVADLQARLRQLLGEATPQVRHFLAIHSGH